MLLRLFKPGVILALNFDQTQRERRRDSLGLQPIEWNLGTNGTVGLVSWAFVRKNSCTTSEKRSARIERDQSGARDSRVLVRLLVLLAPVTSHRYARL